MEKIFIQESEGGQLRAVENAEYEAEEVLQGLLAEHPDLLGGGAIEADDPPAWLLINREVGVPDSADGYERWSLDHLFVDQRGVPTLIEVKRSTDARIRREVVGQMLDYAANGLSYWRVERLRELLVERLGGVDEADRELVGLLGEDADQEGFWSIVEDNLRRGRVRMIFVADHIPPELQRIVEYLNEQLRDADVLAVAIKRYEQGDRRVYVTKVIGETGAVQAERTGQQRDRRDYHQRLAVASRTFHQCIDRLTVWAEERGWVTGTTYAYWTTRAPNLVADVKQASPKDERMWLSMDVLPEDLAEEMRVKIRDLGGSKAAIKWPGLDAKPVIDNWDHVRAAILNRVADALDTSSESVSSSAT